MSMVFFNERGAIDVRGEDGRGRFSGKVQSQLEREYGQLEIIPIEEAARRIEQAACMPCIEITHEQFNDALEVLPPLLWKQDADVESFRCCEATSGSVHASYVRLGRRYFTMRRPISDSHEMLVAMATQTMLAGRRTKAALT
ncbi:MAG: hypothetical protein A2580_09210 [Hydrogenophilales bacterium RIFOXYD1_FULL_62_11]|nr:MAG: hypothetical protein A2580_09210 [Hydrogenophilales bacterium RIFOXYD1_FULL_62_11]